MTFALAIEASKPDGTVFRLALGWKFFFPLASLFTGLAGLL
jgi:hypothetical protein